MNGSSIRRAHGVGSYLAGFVLALVLTAIPFYLVYYKLLAGTAMLAVIAVTAVLQILVHLKFFLHLSFAETPRENLLSLCFAAVLILMMVGGSFWIMFDLHHRMMPMS